MTKPSNQRPDWEKRFRELEEEYLDIDMGVVEFKKGYQGYAFYKQELQQELAKARKEAIEECIAVVESYLAGGALGELRQKLKGLKT